ncbi:MAG: hypothetical protein IJE02_05520 [Clostridia bacterium]|nr:hypothetical protein [Clostridia bacterium]
MNRKNIGKKLLFPHIAVMIILIPVATAFLVYSMVVLGSESPIAIASYVIAAYTLTIWCFKIPYLIKFFKRFKQENKYIKRWQSDARLRIKISLYGTLVWNAAYAAFQLGLGIKHHTFWFYSLAGYYIALGTMRFFLVRHARRYDAGEKMREELIKYRACGIVFLIMNLTLTIMIFFMVYWNRTFIHHEITTIAMAAYTFSSLSMAIVNVIKYRQFGSPVYSASRAISLAAASVSMLTLESTMLTTFGSESTSLATRRLFLALSGGAISLFIITMAIAMIVQSTKKLRLQNTVGEK